MEARDADQLPGALFQTNQRPFFQHLATYEHFSETFQVGLEIYKKEMKGLSRNFSKVPAITLTGNSLIIEHSGPVYGGQLLPKA